MNGYVNIFKKYARPVTIFFYLTIIFLHNLKRGLKGEIWFKNRWFNNPKRNSSIKCFYIIKNHSG